VRELRDKGPDGSSASVLSFSPDGKLLAVGDRSLAVRVWDVVNEKQRLSLQAPRQSGQGVRLNAPAFSPDGTLVAAAGEDYTVRLWDAGTGEQVHVFRGHRGWIWHLAFSPDGAALLSGSDDGTALLWDVAGRGLRLAADPSPQQLERLWADLADKDGAAAFRARRTLTVAAPLSVPFLRKELVKAVRSEEAERLTKLIADLDSDRFGVRQKALSELEKLGHAAEPALRSVLRGGKVSLEVSRRIEKLLARLPETPLTAENLRQARALGVLEHAGTAEARAALESLAKGPPVLHLTLQAQEALRRLGVTPGTP
jgi:hypothetical protein